MTKLLDASTILHPAPAREATGVVPETRPQPPEPTRIPASSSGTDTVTSSHGQVVIIGG